MNAIIRTFVVAIVALLLALPAAGLGAAAVEQGTITVTGIWPAGQEPTEAVEVCFTLALAETGDMVVDTTCVTDPYVATFGPADPPIETGHTYYAWQSLADGTLIGDPQPVLLTDVPGVATVDVPLTAPSGTGAIEVHVSACPVDIGDRTLYDACHANGYAGDEIVLDGPVWQSAVTGGDIGAVRFEGLPAGDYTIAEGQMHGEFERFEVYCSIAGGEHVPVEDRSNGRAAVLFPLGEAQEIICDWYNIPVQELVTTPTPVPTVAPDTVILPEPTPAAGTVIVLPSTGTGPLGGDRPMAISLVSLSVSTGLLIAAGFLVGCEGRQRR